MNYNYKHSQFSHKSITPSRKPKIIKVLTSQLRGVSPENLNSHSQTPKKFRLMDSPQVIRQKLKIRNSILKKNLFWRNALTKAQTPKNEFLCNMRKNLDKSIGPSAVDQPLKPLDTEQLLIRRIHTGTQSSMNVKVKKKNLLPIVDLSKLIKFTVQEARLSNDSDEDSDYNHLISISRLN